MKIEGIVFGVVDWSQVVRVEHPGETGTSWWRTVEVGAIRLREVEYTPGYLADHWCERGHIVRVVEGELTTELQDGRTFVLKPGMSYHVASGREPHRSRTTVGARLFIVD